MPHPLVVHCRRAPHDVYIGRPGPWGNPYLIGRDGTREDVIAEFGDYILRQPRLTARLGELRGRVLGCWCAPLACHGDVLARLANGPVIRVSPELVSGSGREAAVRPETGRLLACLECRNPERPVPQSSGTREERAARAVAHLRVTGHALWLTMSEEEE